MSNASVYQSGLPPPCPAKFNIATYVLASAERTPNKTALEVLGGPGDPLETWTYEKLKQAVLGTATGLARLGLHAGDKLVLRIGHRSDFPIVFLAALALGAVPVPTSAKLTQPEFDRILSDLGDVFAVVADPEVSSVEAKVQVWGLEQLRDFRILTPTTPIATKADDPAYLIYTSGSSGAPKGVVHAHRAVWARQMMWDGWYGLKTDDRMLHAGAFNWTFTLGTGLLDPWAIGATALVYAGPPDRHIWSDLARAHDATLFAAAPGVYRQLLTSDRDLKEEFKSVRHGLVAGEALSPAIRNLWEDRTGCPIYEALGMSEISTFVSGAPGIKLHKGQMGRPQSGRKIAILGADRKPVPTGEPGQLAVHKSDPGLMLGYHQAGTDPHLPLAGEWFETGDMATLREDGQIRYLGRGDALITAGGFRIAPEEVESALTRFDGIQEAAVCGFQVKDGAIIVAALIVSDHEIEEAALQTYLSKQLADYKRPRLYKRVRALPKSMNGKLNRNGLPEIISGRMDTP